jgi:hypothetical protein
VIRMKCLTCFELIERLCDYVQIVVCPLVHMLANCLLSVFDSICDPANLSGRFLGSGRCSTSSVSQNANSATPLAVFGSRNLYFEFTRITF